jgi:hypothetical protein
MNLKITRLYFHQLPSPGQFIQKTLCVLLGLSHHDLLHAVLNSVQVALPRQQQVVELLPLLSAEGSVHRARHVHFLGRLVHSGSHQLRFQYCKNKNYISQVFLARI